MAVAYLVFSSGNYRVLCLGADAKPAADDGITLVETDTGKFFLRTGGAWVEQLNDSYGTAAQGALGASALQPSGNGGSLTGLTKTQVGLANVDNTSDAAKPVSTATQTALDLKQATSAKGQINGYAGLDGAGLVPVAQLPGLPTAWGAITGTLSAQTDLQSALDGKQVAGSYATGGGTATGTNTGDQTISDATITTTDITTNDATTAKHGFLQKLPGGTTNFLRADGAFAAPTAAAADPSYSPGSFTVATETQRFAPHRLKMTTTQRITIEGTGRLSCLN